MLRSCRGAEWTCTESEWCSCSTMKQAPPSAFLCHSLPRFTSGGPEWDRLGGCPCPVFLIYISIIRLTSHSRRSLARRLFLAGHGGGGSGGFAPSLAQTENDKWCDTLNDLYSWEAKRQERAGVAWREMKTDFGWGSYGVHMKGLLPN